MPVRFIHNSLVSLCNRTHCCLQQHSVRMCKHICKINKLQFLIQFYQQVNVLSVVCNKLFIIVVVKLIKCSFIVYFAFAKFIFTNSIQAVTVHFMICVFAIQLHIVHMHSTMRVKCLLCSTKTFKLTFFGKLIPQTKLTCMTFAQYTTNSVYHIGNIKAFTVPTCKDICVINQVQEHAQQFCFIFTKHSIRKLVNDCLCFCFTHTFWLDSQTYSCFKPIQMHCNCSHRIKWILWRSKSHVLVKVSLNIKKCNMQIWRISRIIIFSKCFKNNIYITFIQTLVSMYFLFSVELLACVTNNTFQFLTKNTCKFATWIFVVECILGRIFFVFPLAVYSFYYVYCICISVMKSVYITH